MKNDGLIEPQKLLAYCNGDLDDKDAVEAIRSSEDCINWVSEHRFIRILMKSGEQENVTSDISRDKLAKFVAEELPSKEMLEIESALIRDPQLLDEFLAIRTERIAENAPAIPKELDAGVRNLLLSNAIEASTSAERPAQNTLSSKSSSIREFISNIFSINRLSLAGGMAVVLLVAIVGGKQVGLFGSSDGHPLIIASIETSDVALTFRSSGVARKPFTISEGKLTSIDLKLIGDIRAALIDYERDPSNEGLRMLVAAVNQSVELTAMKAKELSFDYRQIGVIQVHPLLWEKIRSDGGTKSIVKVSVVKNSDPTQKADKVSPFNILYFSFAK
jgi:hypothetical protein